MEAAMAALDTDVERGTAHDSLDDDVRRLQPHGRVRLRVPHDLRKQLHSIQERVPKGGYRLVVLTAHQLVVYRLRDDSDRGTRHHRLLR